MSLCLILRDICRMLNTERPPPTQECAGGHRSVAECGGREQTLANTAEDLPHLVVRTSTFPAAGI
jgi:hypothetical protein